MIPRKSISEPGGRVGGASRDPRARVTVVGSVNRDMLLRVASLPRAGQTVVGHGLVSAIGGKGANQAVAAVRLGAEVRLVARVGADGTGELAALRREGVDTAWCLIDDVLPTGLAVVQVDAAGENLITIAPGANGALAVSDLPSLSPEPSGRMHVVLLQQEVPADVVLEAARRARAAGAVVVLNPAPFRPLPDGLLALVDVLVPNAGELGELLAAPEPTTVAEVVDLVRTAALPCPAVVVTLGAKGALVSAGGEQTLVSAPRVDVVDTVGAGDTLCGALAEALGRGTDLVAATRWAVHAAALAVTGEGAQSSMPDARAVRALIDRLAPQRIGV
jgi:ribokinase